jgi:ubiquinone/menaquinone biosynthesis C-methylase UbiE
MKGISLSRSRGRSKILAIHKPSSSHQHICPWWCCFTFDNIFRKLFQNPELILKPYVRQSWTVLEVGPGMGYFTIPLARLVGEKGRVIAADIQQKMLDVIDLKALRAGVRDRIKLQKSTPDKIEINEPIDFCLVFWMVHEVPNRERFFDEIYPNLKQNGLLLLVEPKIHVSRENFNESLAAAQSSGLSIEDRPSIFLSYATLLKK